MTDNTPATSTHQAPAFAKVGLAVYTLLIVYASLYPFSGWHDNGLHAFAYLSAPLPHYWTKFDALTNIIGYAPFGILAVFALHPRVRGIWAAAIVLLGGILLSGSMEAIQTFLPTRVQSNLDFFTNIGGTVVGIALGLRVAAPVHEHRRFLQWKQSWFLPEASRGLIVVGLWPLAQIYPQATLFGHAQLTPILSDWAKEWWSMPLDLDALLRNGMELTVEQYWLSEAVITACGLSGALLTLLCLTRKRAPRLLLAAGLLLTTLIVKLLATALLFAPENAFVWLTPAAQGGLLSGCAMLFGLAFAPPAAQRRIAVLMLMVSLVVVNVIPANPYFVATLQSWVQGKFLNFNGAAQFLSLFWPFFALWFLLHPVHSVKSR